MKNFARCLLVLALFCVNACRQQDAQPVEFPDVPVAVVQAVKSAYPTATTISFTEIDKGNVWQSDFSIQSVTHQAKINTSGSILESYALGVSATQAVTLPAAATAYITKTYPAYKTVSVGDGQYNNQKAYKVLLLSSTEEVTIIFDANGAVILEFKSAVTTTPETPKTFPITKAEELPAAASLYLRENGMTFAKGVATVNADGKKSYLVIATKGTTTYELTFDNEGKLLKSSSSTPAPTTVEIKSISELPAAAVAFLAGYTLEKGSVVTKEGVKTYSVAVLKEGKRYEITFNGDGKVLTNTYTPRTVETALASSSDLPGNVREYLTKNYAGWAFVKGVLVTTDTKPTTYNVYIKVGEITYVVVFNGDGSFVSSKKA